MRAGCFIFIPPARRVSSGNPYLGGTFTTFATFASTQKSVFPPSTLLETLYGLPSNGGAPV